MYIINTELELKVDGKNIGMNNFVRRMMSNIIFGILSSLHNTNDWKNVTITIRRN